MQASSIAGYRPKEWLDEEWRHGMFLGLASKNKYPEEYWHTTVAHEIGHNFGAIVSNHAYTIRLDHSHSLFISMM